MFLHNVGSQILWQFSSPLSVFYAKCGTHRHTMQRLSQLFIWCNLGAIFILFTLVYFLFFATGEFEWASHAWNKVKWQSFLCSVWNYVKFAFFSQLFCVVPIHTKGINMCTTKCVSAISFWKKSRVPTLSVMIVHMRKAGLVLGRTFWMLNSMLRVSRWCEAFQHVSVCLSVSLFNGSWVGCHAFFSPYSQHSVGG